MSRTRIVAGRLCTAATALLPAAAALLPAAAVLFPVVACTDGPADVGATALPGADPERATAHMRKYGCGACHTIPGVRDATGTVGPPLTDYGLRSFIAGTLPNSGENLVLWIVNPQAIEPGTAMPFLGVSQPDARDIAAYLHSLR